jgi:hypothetical protein
LEISNISVSSGIHESAGTTILHRKHVPVLFTHSSAHDAQKACPHGARRGFLRTSLHAGHITESGGLDANTTRSRDDEA